MLIATPLAAGVAAGVATFDTGDLAFVHPHVDSSSALDRAILATGVATVQWLRSHGLPCPSNETAAHVAIALRNSSGVYFVQAIWPSVVVTPAARFFMDAGAGAIFYRGVPEPALHAHGTAAATIVLDLAITANTPPETGGLHL